MIQLLPPARSPMARRWGWPRSSVFWASSWAYAWGCGESRHHTLQADWAGCCFAPDSLSAGAGVWHVTWRMFGSSAQNACGVSGNFVGDVTAGRVTDVSRATVEMLAAPVTMSAQTTTTITVIMHVPTLPRPGWVVRFAQIQRVLEESGGRC